MAGLVNDEVPKIRAQLPEGIEVQLAAVGSALVAALVLGPRKGFPETAMPPHNLTMTVAGAAMLWVGWFGFNGGSQLQVTGIENANAVALIFVNTNMAAAGGLVAILIRCVSARPMPGPEELWMTLAVGAVAVAQLVPATLLAPVTATRLSR